MRFDEIENTDAIMKILLHNFSVRSDEVSIENGYVSVDGNCELVTDVRQLPVKFKKIGHTFVISHHGLVTLNGCPKEVGGSFLCVQNDLVSLVGGPQTVGNNYRVSGNKLSNLIGSPQSIDNGVFVVMNNPLISLEGLPKRIDRIQ